MRSRTCTPAPDGFRFATESARYNMASQPRSFIDFSLATIATSADGDANDFQLRCPLSWSSQNILAFPRGNRIYLKNITSTGVEDVGYTFKPSKKHGILRMLDFCRDVPNLLALGTSTDNIELWDIETKKMTRSWTAVGITCLEWNEGRVLAVGDKKGSIQYYDTRIDDRKEMKMKKGKVTRHEAPITTISWNRKDPSYLASGDKDGVIYYWDSRQDAPLKMGEMVQRRRKMQHDHAVSVSILPSHISTLPTPFSRLWAGVIRVCWLRRRTPRTIPVYFVSGRWMTIARISNVMNTTPRSLGSTRLCAKKLFSLTALAKSPLIQATSRHRFQVLLKTLSWRTHCRILNKRNRLNTLIQIQETSEAFSTEPERGWWSLSVGSRVELRRVTCRSAMCGEGRLHLPQSRLLSMEG